MERKDDRSTHLDSQELPGGVAADDPGGRRWAVEEALRTAAAADDAPAMARLLLSCATECLVSRVSPLEAVRAGHLERARRLADGTDEGRRFIWHLLLAGELQARGCPAAARATLERLRADRLPDFYEREGETAAFLLLTLFDLDRELAGMLYRRLTEEGGHFPTPEHLAALSRGRLALEAARELPNADRRDAALIAIGRAQIRAGSFASAAHTLQAVASIRQRAATLTSLASAQGDAGETEAARATLEDALAVAQSMKRRRDEILRDVALAAVPIGSLDMARQVAPRIRHPGWRGEVEASIAAALARRGEVEAARQVADQIRAPEGRAQALTALAQAQAHSGDPAAGRLTLGTALEAAAAISLRTDRVRALCEIGVLQAQVGEREAAGRTFTALIEMAAAPRSLESRIWFLGITGLARRQAGDAAAGAETLEAAREAALGIEDPHLRGKALRALATEEAQSREFAIALATAAGIEDPHQQSRALASIAAAQGRAGQRDAAHATARRIEEDRVHVQTLQALAAAEREAGDLQAATASLATARDLAARLEEGWNQFPLLSEIALAYLEMQQTEAARDTLATLLLASQAAVDRDRRDTALVSLATAQASAGAFDEARRTALGIAGDGYRETALGALACARAAAGEIAAAWELIEQYLDPYPRDEVMAAVVAAQVQVERREQEPLGELLETIRRRVRVLEDGGDRQGMLGEIAMALARARAFLPALETAQEVEWDVRRADVFGGIAALQARCGQRETAQITLATALECAGRESNPWWRVDPLLDIAEALAEAGERAMGRAVLLVARTSAAEIDRVSGRDHELRRIVEAQSSIRDFSAAAETAESIADERERVAALACFAAARAEAGEHAAARDTLARVEERMQALGCPPGGDEVMKRVALARARLGEFGAALATARQISDEPQQVEALERIAALQAQAGDRAAARDTLSLALQTARQIKTVSYQSEALALLAVGQARLGFVEDVARTAAEIRSDIEEHYPAIARALLERGAREQFKSLLVRSSRSPEAACQCCLLLPAMYPEQCSTIEAIIRSAGEQEAEER